MCVCVCVYIYIHIYIYTCIYNMYNYICNILAVLPVERQSFVFINVSIQKLQSIQHYSNGNHCLNITTLFQRVPEINRVCNDVTEY